MTIEAVKADLPIPPGLPSALRPWSPVFQTMPEAHLRLIGGLMGQLNALLEDTFEIDVQSYGEFNGYDGMALRGEIERLLPSEWLWRDLAPDEFLRRFAERELLYHRPSFESPTDERTHLVIIDSGRAMLGRPRIIALAALLSLSAIARAQGAKLLWAAPLSTIDGWQPLLRQRDLQSFLLSANPLSLGAADIEGLVQKAVGAAKDSEFLLWVLSGAALPPVAPSIKTNQFVISETMALNAAGEPVAEASVRLIAHSGRQKEAALAYPREEECVSILREPFRPPRVVPAPRADAGPAIEANPHWAPRELLVVPTAHRVLIRVPNGLLAIGLGELGNPLFLPIEAGWDLLGVRWGGDAVNFAVTRKSGADSHLQVRKIRIYQTGKADETVPDITFEALEPVAHNVHGPTALPPLIKPGRRYRLLAATAKGEVYTLYSQSAERHRQFSHLPLIGIRDDWAYLLLDPSGGRRLLIRNLATSHCMTFALAPDATAETLEDIVHWPAVPRTSDGMLLLTRCADGHWRGGMGRPHLADFSQFPTKFVDIDLTFLGRPAPLGEYPGQRGNAPFPAYRACFWSPEEKGLFYCGFNLAGNVDIEPLSVPGVSSVAEQRPGDPHPRMVMYKESLLRWHVDQDGYVHRIDGWYPVNRAADQTKMLIHHVAALMEEARWLSA